jgi:uncharacterized membrane protein (DUF106 family)
MRNLIIIIIIIIILFYWAKTVTHTIKNCYSQNIIANAQKDGKKGKSHQVPHPNVILTVNYLYVTCLYVG